MNNPFDTEFEYLLTHYIRANGQNHDIRLILNDNNVHLFKDLMRCDLDILKDFKRMKQNAFVSLNKLNVKKINNVILYHQFMRKNGDTIMAVDPDQ